MLNMPNLERAKEVSRCIKSNGWWHDNVVVRGTDVNSVFEILDKWIMYVDKVLMLVSTLL